MKIFKTKWYLVQWNQPPDKTRNVLVQHGGFNSMTKASNMTYQPVADKNDFRWKQGGIPMERKPGFERCFPVKGEHILKRLQFYSISEGKS